MSYPALPAAENLSRAYDVAYKTRLQPRYDTHEAWLPQDGDRALVLIQRALEARRHAISYRDIPFRVGAAAVGIRYEPAMQIHTVGANFKPERDGPINIHAEGWAVESCRKLGADAVSMIVVAGDLQHDQQSGRETHTLHPCGICRAELTCSPLIHEQSTLLMSVAPHTVDGVERIRTLEWYNLEGLKQYHEQGDESGITTVTFEHGLPLAPHAASTESNMVDLVSRDGELNTEADEWHARVTLPMLDWRLERQEEAA